MDGDVLHAGSMAPEFVLPDQDGQRHVLTDYRGRWVFLCFYPKDNTPGCVEELCAIRDHIVAFNGFGVVVLATSGDSRQEHKRFAKQYQLPFALLSDSRKKVADRYDVLRRPELLGSNTQEIIRKSFLINIIGEIEKMYENISPKAYAERALNDLAEMGKKD